MHKLFAERNINHIAKIRMQVRVHRKSENSTVMQCILIFVVTRMQKGSSNPTDNEVHSIDTCEGCLLHILGYVLRSSLNREGKSGVAKSGVVSNRSEGYLCAKKPCQLVMAGVQDLRGSKSLSNSAGGGLSKKKGG